MAKTIYVFECKSPGWQNWVPMTHIEPVTSLRDAENKLNKLWKERGHSGSWRYMPYDRREEVTK